MENYLLVGKNPNINRANSHFFAGGPITLEGPDGEVVPIEKVSVRTTHDAEQIRFYTQAELRRGDTVQFNDSHLGEVTVPTEFRSGRAYCFDINDFQAKNIIDWPPKRSKRIGERLADSAERRADLKLRRAANRKGTWWKAALVALAIATIGFLIAFLIGG